MSDECANEFSGDSKSLAVGYAALRAGDAGAARRAFDAAFADDPDYGPMVEGLARTAYLELDFVRSIDEWNRAYSPYRTAGDQVSAVRSARTLAFLHGSVLGDWAVMNGWIARGPGR
jgi:hypothetical protein